ncbi:MAG: hypothetical protein IT306_30885 [Chloroflexi bacterium]|nr:hypothetical protein [Chloroflexota bacterium]
MGETPRGGDPEASQCAPPAGSAGPPTSALPTAVATDVGAWRVVLPVLRELSRRGVPYRVLLANPSARVAVDDGIPYETLAAASVDERAEAVLAAGPSALLLGTSVQGVVERELAVRARGRVPTLGILDAMLFVERRFGPGLAELPDVLACPDPSTVERLRAAGAPAARLHAAGNPTLEEIALLPRSAPPPVVADEPVDVLFVSSPVGAMRLRGAFFEIDEHEALADLYDVLDTLRAEAPAGFRVRVRLHPVQRDEGLLAPPPGLTVLPDDDPDRLRSCGQARVVVGLSSTLLGEARLLPRAAVAYLPGPFWQQERVFGPEYGVTLAPDRDTLRAAILAALLADPEPAPLAGHLGAAGRIADLLEGLAR